MRDQPVRGKELSGDLEGSSDGSQPMDAMSDFWSIEGNYIYRHDAEPRVQFYMPKEESFPIPLRYIDVVRTTHTTSGVLQESRIDDYWNIDGHRNLSEPWSSFTQFTTLNEKPPDGCMWSGRRLTQILATTRPHHLWPAQREKKQSG